jgi:transposase
MFITQHYPNYRAFFSDIDGKTSLAFFSKYPSPDTLKTVLLKDLTAFIHEHSQGNMHPDKAKLIMESLEETAVEHQEIRDETVRSTIRQIEFNMQEIERLEATMTDFMEQFDCTLCTMTGINIVTASQILSCIGDIDRFSSSAKLARYSGVAPVSYSSGKKDMQYANTRGNRELNSILFNLAVRLSSTVGSTNKSINPFFYEYFHRKISEGKTKRQALKCVQRRLVNIIWTMLTNGEEYVNPPMFNAPKTEQKNNA